MIFKIPLFKRQFMKKFTFAYLFLLVAICSNAQQLFTETFNLAPTTPLVGNGWFQIGNTSTNPIIVDSNVLSYSGYILSGTGRASSITTSGQDIYADFGTVVSANSVYASLLVSPKSVQTAGDYFFAFLPSNANNNYIGRVFLKSASVGYFLIGLSKGNEPPIYGTDSFELNTTTLVALKYSFYSGGNNNDTLALYTFHSGFPLSEPSPNVKLAGTTNDLVNISRVAIRQGTATNAPSLLLGGIRVASTWEDLNTATVSGQPKTLSNFRFTGKLQNTSLISWTKPNGYVDSLFNVVVFLRNDTMASSFATPSQSALSYTANNDFTGIASAFQLDSLAKCVYNGDGNNVTLLNLDSNTRYYAVAYVVRTDTVWYGNAIFSNGRTSINSALNLQVLPASVSSVTTSWTNSPNYVSATHTTLVFIKEGSPINWVDPNRPASRYVASANFGIGTKFQEDTSAFCIYNGNLTSVTTNGLKQGVTYYVSVFFVRNADSVYSLPAIAFGNSAENAPYREIGPLVKTNITTGVIDSTGKRALLRGVVNSVNFRTLGLQFVLRDQTGGITVFSNNRNYSYAVAVGDSIEVAGTIAQQNGLAIIGNLDTVLVIGKNAITTNFTLVQTLSEQTENLPVKLSKLSIISNLPTANWPTNSTVLTKNEETGDTIRIRIYSGTGFVQIPAPTGFFSIQGLGLQTSTSNQAPFPFNGYSISPRNPSDITIINDSINEFAILTPQNNAEILLDGDSSGSILLQHQMADIVVGKGIITYEILLDETNGDFQTPLFSKLSDNTGLDTNTTVTYQEILDNLPGLNKLGDSVTVRLAIKANLNDASRMSSNAITLTFKLGVLTHQKEMIGNEIQCMLYPNPFQGLLQAESNQTIISIEILDLLGRSLKTVYHANVIETAELPAGTYLVKISSKHGSFRQLIIKE
jgi:hypothetical protein